VVVAIAVIAALVGTPLAVHAVGGGTPVPTPAPVAGGNGPSQGAPPAGSATTNAFGNLARNPSLISNGCATIDGIHVCVPAFSMDGQTIPPIVLIQRVLGAVTSSGSGSAVSASDPTVIQAAEASVLLDHLLYTEAPNDGVSVTQDEAAAQAQQELALYLNDPASGQAAGVVPAGMTPGAYFSSAAVVAGYQRAMTIGLERGHILSKAPAGSDHQTVLVQWMKQVLPRHSVQVNGAPPTLGLADALPPQP
ncbi:MAG: hypothetical protein ACREQ5_16310, partial [Candidatus Dormibacteria bacterium]